MGKGTGSEIVAEFSEVIKQLGRICESNFGECDICDLRPFCPSKALLECYAKSWRVERLEKMVMEWAAEHPEPVYPTWEEWLITQGVIKENPNGVGRPMPKLFERIPPDIAQKLGIEPKKK